MSGDDFDEDRLFDMITSPASTPGYAALVQAWNAATNADRNMLLAAIQRGALLRQFNEACETQAVGMAPRLRQ